MSPRFEAVGVEGEVIVREKFEDGFVVFFGNGASATEELMELLAFGPERLGERNRVPLGMSYKLLTISGRDGRNRPISFAYASPALPN